MTRAIIEYTHQNDHSIPAVIKVKGKYVCQRCQNYNSKLFYRDHLGVYCQQCIMFDKSSTYRQIQRKKVEFSDSVHYSLNKMFYLSQLQQIASKKCLEAYKLKRNLLIFAVCGAGKTEIVYDVILKALNERKTVCFTTPRKDVVLELLPRLKRDFSQVAIVGLYGGSQDKGKVGNLYVTTTHQLIHYYHYFDLVILDEVDAFPYYNNKMLESFIVKAKKETAPIIYLTATPTKKLKYLMMSKKLDYFIIPARFHRKPIPIPKVVMVHHMMRQISKGKIPHKILNWLKQKADTNKQAFIFVPSIQLGLLVESQLAKHFNCLFVNSTSKNRKEIIDRFRNGKLQFIITTTILERGVTVSNVDVCIIGACEAIFDERAIVQIVGRAGRDKNFPLSDVRLFCEHYTRAIKDSLKHIKNMNKRNEKVKLET